MTNYPFITRFEQLAKWPYAGIALLFFIAMNALILSQVNRFLVLTDGTDMLEVPGMLSQDLYAVAQSYPAEAIQLYQQVLQPLDILYPASLGIFLVVLLSVLTVRLFPRESRLRFLPLLGFLPTIADWLENLGVFAILRTLDTPQPVFALWTKALITIKMGSGLLLLVVLGLFIMWISQAVSARLSNRQAEHAR